MSRILAREYAFKMIFQYLFSKDADAQNICDDEQNLSSEEKDFSLELFSAATKNFDEISNKIAENLKGKYVRLGFASLSNGVFFGVLRVRKHQFVCHGVSKREY